MDFYEKFYNHIRDNVNTRQAQVDYITDCFQDNDLFIHKIKKDSIIGFIDNLKIKTNGRKTSSLFKFFKINENISKIEIHFKEIFKNKKELESSSKEGSLNDIYSYIPSIFNERIENNYSLTLMEQEYNEYDSHNKKEVFPKTTLYEVKVDINFDKLMSICFFILCAKELWENNEVPSYSVFNDIFENFPYVFNRNFKNSVANTNSQNLSNIIKIGSFINVNDKKYLSENSRNIIELNFIL